MLISGGIIQDVGPSRRIENLTAARNAREINAAGRVVMPGFVDAHTHPVSGPPWLDEYEARIANLHEMQGSGEGFQAGIQALRTLSAKRLEFIAHGMIRGMVRHGTTSLEARSGYPLDNLRELKVLRVLAALNKNPLDITPTYLGGQAVPEEFQGEPDRYLEWLCSTLMPKIRQRRLAQFVDGCCKHDAFSLEQVRRYLLAARELGFHIKLHVDELSKTEITRLAMELDAVSIGQLGDISEADVDALARSKTITTLLPGTTFHLGLERYAPARSLIDRGAAVALATGYNPRTSPTYNMQIILSLACIHMHMSPAEAISAATINSAHAILRADQVGSLDPGKQADLLLMNASDYREIPYYFGVNNVQMTIKRGIPLFNVGASYAVWPKA